MVSKVSSKKSFSYLPVKSKVCVELSSKCEFKDSFNVPFKLLVVSVLLSQIFFKTYLFFSVMICAYSIKGYLCCFVYVMKSHSFYIR